MPKALKTDWYIYLIQLANGALYTGITVNVERRFAEHSSMGTKAARSLKGKGPLKLVFNALAGNHSQALKLEIKIKSLPRLKKLDLINGKLNLNDLLNPTP